MELRHLRYFRAIGREEHFGRAALQLRIAQPALTRQIRDLETELGVELFERLPRGVRLSEAGKIFLAEAEEVLAHVDRARDLALRLASGHLGTLRVGLSEIIGAHHFISEGLRLFREREPGVELDLRSLGSLQQILAIKEGTLDVGIVYDAHMDEREAKVFETRRIGTGLTMLAVCEGHRLADRESVSMADLGDEPALWPMRKTAPRYYERIMTACLRSGTTPHIIQECTTNSIMLSLVASGMGVGFVTATPPLATLHNVRLVPISDLDLSFDVLLVSRRWDNSAALKRFIDMLAGGNAKAA